MAVFVAALAREAFASSVPLSPSLLLRPALSLNGLTPRQCLRSTYAVSCFHALELLFSTFGFRCSVPPHLFPPSTIRPCVVLLLCSFHDYLPAVTKT